MKFWEGGSNPRWRRGFPGVGSSFRAKYGLYVERHENPWRASLTVYASWREAAKFEDGTQLAHVVWAGELRSWHQWFRRREKMDAKLRKLLESARGAVKQREVADADFEKLYPMLHGFMTCTEGLDKGTFRETGSMYLTANDGAWKLCLGDRENDTTLWMEKDTFAELLAATEERLASGKADWRKKAPSGKYAKAEPKKRKGG